jgi:hypothetical protein
MKSRPKKYTFRSLGPIKPTQKTRTEDKTHSHWSQGILYRPHERDHTNDRNDRNDRSDRAKYRGKPAKGFGRSFKTWSR